MRALEKLPADRWGTAREFAEALHGGSSAAAANTMATSRHRADTSGDRSWRARLRDPLVVVLAAVAVASMAFAAWARTVRRATTRTSYDSRSPRYRVNRRTRSGYSTLAISPDGRAVVYMGLGDDKRQQLMLRTLDDIVARPLPETSRRGKSPVFSPDGKSVAFIRSNRIFKVALDGTRPQLLASAPATYAGMTWLATGELVVSGNVALYAIPEAGGQVREIMKADHAAGEVFVSAPVMAGDEGLVLFFRRTRARRSAAQRSRWRR